MPIEITIPRLGWSMEEANFVNWLKKDGEAVSNGELLFTLESEKAAQDIEATDSGILRIPTDGPASGEVVKVGQVISHLFAENESRESSTIPSMKSRLHAKPFQETNPESRAKVASKTEVSRSKESDQIVTEQPISPRARRLAAQLGVDTTRLRGSGRTGRIIEKDVRHAPPALSIMRRTIAQRTSASFASTPHFYLRSEVDATALIQLRNELIPKIENAGGVRLTLTDLLLRAQARALKSFPAANAFWRDDHIVNLTACDVGLVVGLTEGMRIPIVRSAEAGELAALAQQRASLVASARSGALAVEEMEGGATSLSNLGNTKVDEFAAVISLGQSSMLAVGRASPRPFALDGELTVRTTLRLCLSVDHRVLDGAPAAEFLGYIIEFLEKPEKLV